jgi:hypothetical protein
MRRALAWWRLGAVLLMVVLAACDEPPGAPAPDAAASDLAAPDIELPPKIDLRPDLPDARPDAAPDAAIDAHPGEAGADLPATDAPGPPPNDTCPNATPVSLVGGKATVVSDLAGAQDTVSMPAGSCGATLYGTAGPDLFYELQVTAGKVYHVSLDAKFDGALYAFTDCNDPAGTCLAGNDDKFTDHLAFAATVTETVIIGVDTTSPPAPGASSFTLHLYENQAPANDTCATATPIALVGGTATLAGDTCPASDWTGKQLLTCLPVGPWPTSGQDVFYALTPTAGKGYALSFSTKPYPGQIGILLYVFTSCADVAGSCITGNDPNGTMTAHFVAASSSTHFVAVDATGFGSWCAAFSLEVQEYTPPTNDLCAQPQPLVWSGKQASASGDTSLAQNDLQGVSCGGFLPLDWPQLYYTVLLTGGHSYHVTLAPDAGFDAAVYAVPSSTACTAGAVDTACQAAFADQQGAGTPENLALTPATGGEWIIAVDSASSLSTYAWGTFTLTVEDTSP